MGISRDEELVEKAKAHLTKIDSETFERRAKHLAELMVFFVADVQRKVTAPESTLNFWKEALTDYLNECFRSCIFSCASAVEQAFKERLIVDSDDPEETFWKFEVRKFTLGDILKEAKHNKKLGDLVSTAGNVNRLRNEIAVHPIQIPQFPQPQDKRKILLTNLIMIRAVKKLLATIALPNEYAERIRNLSVGEEKERTLKEILDDPTAPEIRLAWHDLQRALLGHFSYFALENAHRIMVELYGEQGI